MTLLEIERSKYQRMWAHPIYRTAAQGARCAAEVIAKLEMKPGQSITDYGAGSGRASMIFDEFGLDVHLVDIADNANESDFPVTIAALWDLPDSLPETDWCFCCDVLEHLPEDQIDVALAGIAKRTKTGGFLQPALRQEECGREIGETLHLTVRPAIWWFKKVEAHFREVQVMQTKAARKWQLPLRVWA